MARSTALGSRDGHQPGVGARVRTHGQKVTIAARAVAERKISGHLSYRVATRLQSFSRPNMISIGLRRLYRLLSYFTVFLRCFRPGMPARIPRSFNASLKPTGIMTAICRQLVRLRQTTRQRPCTDVTADLPCRDEQVVAGVLVARSRAAWQVRPFVGPDPNRRWGKIPWQVTENPLAPPVQFPPEPVLRSGIVDRAYAEPRRISSNPISTLLGPVCSPPTRSSSALAAALPNASRFTRIVVSGG